MSDRLTNIEMLLMVADDVRSQGDDLQEEMRQRGVAHAKRVMELMGMLEKARQLLLNEQQRFRQFFPVDHPQKPLPPAEPVPRVLRRETS
jgi:hypothetical protein